MTITIDVIKCAYKQDKEGFVLSFRLHPNDDHDEIARAPLGSPWQMKLIPLNDDGNPDTGEALPSEDTSPVREAAPTGQAGAASRNARKPKQPYTKSEAWANAIIKRTGKTPLGYHPVAPEKRLVQRAALCCADPLFMRFLAEHYDHTIACAEDAAKVVRDLCHVDSRKEIVLGSEAASLWDRLYGKFLVWRRVPELTK